LDEANARRLSESGLERADWIVALSMRADSQAYGVAHPGRGRRTPAREEHVQIHPIKKCLQ
jgi:hypothetical protein